MMMVVGKHQWKALLHSAPPSLQRRTSAGSPNESAAEATNLERVYTTCKDSDLVMVYGCFRGCFIHHESYGSPVFMAFRDTLW